VELRHQAADERPPLMREDDPDLGNVRPGASPASKGLATSIATRSTTELVQRPVNRVETCPPLEQQK